MWKRTVIDPNKEYVLNLCQDGLRFCRVAEKNSEENKECLVFSTEVIPHNLLENYETEIIEENYKTTDGRRFYFGAHGEWMIDVEYEAFTEDKPIPWVNGEPDFAPK